MKRENQQWWHDRCFQWFEYPRIKRYCGTMVYKLGFSLESLWSVEKKTKQNWCLRVWVGHWDFLNLPTVWNVQKYSESLLGPIFLVPCKEHSAFYFQSFTGLTSNLRLSLQVLSAHWDQINLLFLLFQITGSLRFARFYDNQDLISVFTELWGLLSHHKKPRMQGHPSTPTKIFSSPVHFQMILSPTTVQFLKSRILLEF